MQINIYSYTYQNLKSLLKYQFLKRGWIRIAADFILRLTRVPAAGYELRLSRVPAAGYKLPLIPSYGLLGFRWLDKSCGWLRPTADSSSSGWIRVTADSILRLTRVPVAGYDLRLIPSCGWLEFRRFDTGCSWFYPMADSSFILSSKFKGLFCKVHHLYGLFSTNWFQLPLIQALAAASRTLKKLEEAWRSFKTLAATDSSYSACFELRRLIRDLRPIDYLQNFDPDAPWYI